MKIRFTKMQGCGNDYVYINGFTEKLEPEEKPAFVRMVSDRHFGIGSDGAIFINPSDQADFEMEMYNADGSRAEMCGNGIRCVAKYVHDRGMTDREQFTIVSGGQVKAMELTVEDGKTRAVRVDMGEPVLEAARVPVLCKKERAVDEPVTAAGREWRMTCVSMGNPHAVIFVEDTEHFPLEQVGPCFETLERFPNRTNTEFVKVLSPDRVRMRVWERGAGETLACGTGCCATAVACVLTGRTGRRVTVEVLGGELLIEWDERTGHVFMTGPAEFVFDGEIELSKNS
ncbi:MAG: diaminopimelate epimerase [Eubacteriales bacterium]|nr:diaminopimelate epimerase [Eubacteriales bacterium]